MLALSFTEVVVDFDYPNVISTTSNFYLMLF
jgi:hypothetical protein